MNALVTEVESKVPALNESALLRGLERTVFVAGTALTALFLPFFGEIVSLVGAGALTMMAFVMYVLRACERRERACVRKKRASGERKRA